MKKTTLTLALFISTALAVFSCYVSAQNVSFAEAAAFFDFNSDEISPMGIESLEILARNLTEKKVTSVMLIGYTDSIGQPKYNFELGHRRARKVADFLIKKGVKAEKYLVSWGGLKYLHENETPEGRALNRRVQVKAIYEVPQTEATPLLPPQEPER